MTTVTFCCEPGNDLYRAFVDGGGDARLIPGPIGPTGGAAVLEAVEAAEPGGALLVLAEGYPDRRTPVPAGLLDRAAERGLRVYLEYPEELPGVSFGEPRTARWERLAVATNAFGPELPQGSLLAAHACVYLPAPVPEGGRSLVAIARVAGYDRADFGIPEGADAALLELPGAQGVERAGGQGRVLVATTRLSSFRSGRYAPVDAWNDLWARVFGLLGVGDGAPALSWVPVVRPSHGPDEALSADAERRAVERARDWHLRADVLLTPETERRAREANARWVEAVPRAELARPGGDGSHGVLEGFESLIQPDGSQHCRVPLRADSTAETAMVLAVADLPGGSDTAGPRAGEISDRLLTYLFEGSGMCAGPRADPSHPSYGLIAWGVGNHDWEVANYGDDNARVLLACLLAVARRNTAEWNEPILRAIAANFRTTGRNGFRGDRVDQPVLERDGWRHYFDGAPENPAPHFEAYLWACYLWAYDRTGYRPFLERARAAIGALMATGPSGWRRGDTTERSRMLLPLAWLVRAEDTAEHRGWLRTLAADVIGMQDPSGALPEIEAGGLRIFQVPTSNEEYGVTESPIIQRTGDPASDQLYTTGFALVGMHEAYAATGDPELGAAADRLAAYVVRVQTASEVPWLDGTWLRSFDFRRWDYWGSSGDLGWGAWCVELGWAPAWATATLALRAAGTSLWQEAARVVPDAELADRVLREMLEDRYAEGSVAQPD